MIDFDQLLGYKLFIDTSSLMHYESNKFISSFTEFLSSNDLKLIVPTAVLTEIDKHLHGPKDRKALTDAKRAKLCYKLLTDRNDIQIQGYQDESFADSVFLSVFSKFITKYDLALITQDVKLAKDISSIISRQSVKTKHHLHVLKIGFQGDLLSWFNEKRTSSGKSSYQPSTVYSLPKVISNSKDSVIPIKHNPKLGDSLNCPTKGNIQLIKEIDKGGEGTIYQTQYPDVVCKVYLPHKLTKHKRDKLSLMITKPLSIKGVCWPIDIANNKNGEFCGYIMPKAVGVSLAKSIFIKPLLQKRFPQWDRSNLVKLSLLIVEIMHKLHKSNVIIGDINPNNILVKSDSDIYFVDTDSFQIEGYPCPVGTSNFTAPELQGRDFKTFLRDFTHENFAVATLIFMCLIPGKPPYSHQGGADPGSNVKLKHFPYPLGEKGQQKMPPGPWKYIWSNLPYKVKESFYNCFSANTFLTSEQWLQVLLQYKGMIDNNWVTKEIYPHTYKPWKQSQ